METITLTESKRLITLEQTIEAGRKTFVEVGLALAEIRDSRLYRDEFNSFEEYCKNKWGFKKSYAYQLIESANVAESVSAIADIKTESQARELAKVSADKRAEVLERAGDKPTAKAIREAAENLRGTPIGEPRPTTKGDNHGAEPAGGGADGQGLNQPNEVTPVIVSAGETSTRDQSKDFAAALGVSGVDSAARFFSSKVEDIAQAIIDDASDQQLSHAIIEWEVSLRKLRAEQHNRRIENANL
jgi:hypothetical protein